MSAPEEQARAAIETLARIANSHAGPRRVPLRREQIVELARTTCERFGVAYHYAAIKELEPQ
jgi:hypothetical protein